MDRPVQQFSCAVSLRQLFPEARLLHAADVWATDAVDHSRRCAPGTVFAVIRGQREDGAGYISEALDFGATGLLVDKPVDQRVPQCVVPNVRAAYARLCAAIAGDPSQTVRVLGVTGTNGKTTVTWMMRSILKQARQTVGVLGTVEYHDGQSSEPAALTTPDPRTLSQQLARMAALGTTRAAIELSSHALHQDRAAGTLLQAAVVTNITQDHFDYHGGFDEYRRSKARIAELLASDGVLALNRDDLGSWSVRELVSPRSLVSFGLTPMADVSGQILEESLAKILFRLSIRGRSQVCRLSVIGRHNVSNALAAAAVADQLGIPAETIVAGLEHFRAAPGRLERIDAGQPFDLFVDYAHTDDALRRCLQGLRSVAAGRLICVFGAGGDRDRSKRPLLGRAAGLADVPIVTSDNPRSEDPLKIIDDILIGLREIDRDPVVEPDRQAAIQAAIALARPGDCILVAGKGHEREQIIGEQRLPFDDRAVARSLLWDWTRRHHLEQARG